MTLQGTKNLENWCKHVTDGKVNVVNMSTSWRNGLGFCAIIHHFRPDLIDFDNLDPDDVYGNNELAFRVAETHLGIPSLLDPADMLECSIPDRLSILTYLSQFYHAFHSTNLKHRKVGSTSQTSSEASTPSKSVNSQLLTSTMLRSRSKEACHFCQKPVFILERINVAGHLLHRTCFKCRRCGAQLSVVNFYETESGEFCCDMCPDEEKNHVEVTTMNKKIIEDWSGNRDDKVTNATDEDRALGLDLKLSCGQVQNDNENNNVLGDTIVNNVKDDTIVNNVKDDTIVNNVKDDTIVNNVKDDTIINNVKDDTNVNNNNGNNNDEQLTDATDNQSHDVKSDCDCDEAKSSLEDVDKLQSPQVIETDERNLSEEKSDGICHPELEMPEKVDNHSPSLEDVDEGSLKQENLEDEKVVSTNGCEVLQPNSQSDVSGNLAGTDEHSVSVQTISEVIVDEEDKEVTGANVDESCDELHEKNESELSEKDEKGFKNEEVVINKEEFHDKDEKDVCELDEEIYPEDLNPFGDDDEKQLDAEVQNASSNPFGSDGEDEPRTSPSDVALSPKGTPLVGPPKPPRISLNPFGSDFEDDDDDEEEPSATKSTPVHTLRHPPSPTPSSASGSSHRKKRPAPQPPKFGAPVPSPRTSLNVEMRRSAPPRPPPPSAVVAPKERKERENLNRRSQQMLEHGETANHDKALPSNMVLNELPPNKASEGVWKKKKGPAPPRPIPPKLQVKKLPRKAVNQELHDIEVKQQELERQGVKLEKMIRELCEKSDAERVEKGLDNNDRDSLGPEAEDLIMQLFELVNEKNDLFRRQTELMYMKREHRLEEEHADIEYQIRVLMSKAETLRTDDEKLKEEQLIQRLMEIVAQRNEIVDCLEMDRLRELEEDESIEVHMGEFAAVKPPEGDEKTKKKKKEKEKKKKKKDKQHYDDDKDIDTCEISGASPKPSPKKSPLGSAEKDMAKKMKKKLLSTLKPVVLSKRSSQSSSKQH